jgi:hypothetical protein
MSTVYSDLSNGELLGQIRALAGEGLERLAEYVDRAKESDEALHAGLVYAEKLEAALHPMRGSQRGVSWLKGTLQRIAQARPDESPSREWAAFLDAHPELGEAQETPSYAARIKGRTQHLSRLPMVRFDQKEVLAAVKAVLRERKPQGRDYTHASEIARRLVPDGRPCHAERVRVGHVLRRLADAGQVRRIPPQGHGPAQWALA